MKLTIQPRKKEAKGEVQRIRREGNIPAILYGPKLPNQSVVVLGSEFLAIMRGLPTGKLSTTVFSLQIDGKEKKAILKDIQYHRTSYKILHLDFEILTKMPIKVNVPIECVGVADCIGVKLGGALWQTLRTFKVSCQPDKIPQEFVIDVKNLAIGEKKRLSDIPLPEGIKPITPTSEVAVLVRAK